MQVPATSANLGPGFDALGLALGMYDELSLRVTAQPGLRIHAYGDDEPVPTDETNLVAQAARAAFGVLGEQPVGLELQYTARIPHARGLGSSAAAICSGVTAALALRGVRDRDLALRIAFTLERHPDNIAAAIHGGSHRGLGRRRRASGRDPADPGARDHAGCLHPADAHLDRQVAAHAARVDPAPGRGAKCRAGGTCWSRR